MGIAWVNNLSPVSVWSLLLRSHTRTIPAQHSPRSRLPYPLSILCPCLACVMCNGQCAGALRCIARSRNLTLHCHLVIFEDYMKMSVHRIHERERLRGLGGEEKDRTEKEEGRRWEKSKYGRISCNLSRHLFISCYDCSVAKLCTTNMIWWYLIVADKYYSRDNWPISSTFL